MFFFRLFQPDMHHVCVRRFPCQLHAEPFFVAYHYCLNIHVILVYPGPSLIKYAIMLNHAKMLRVILRDFPQIYKCIVWVPLMCFVFVSIDLVTNEAHSKM